jgi:hypothetical protein
VSSSDIATGSGSAVSAEAGSGLPPAPLLFYQCRIDRVPLPLLLRRGGPVGVVTGLRARRARGVAGQYPVLVDAPFAMMRRLFGRLEPAMRELIAPRLVDLKAAGFDPDVCARYPARLVLSEGVREQVHCFLLHKDGEGLAQVGYRRGYRHDDTAYERAWTEVVIPLRSGVVISAGTAPAPLYDVRPTLKHQTHHAASAKELLAFCKKAAERQTKETNDVQLVRRRVSDIEAFYQETIREIITEGVARGVLKKMSDEEVEAARNASAADRERRP